MQNYQRQCCYSLTKLVVSGGTLQFLCKGGHCLMLAVWTACTHRRRSYLQKLSQVSYYWLFSGNSQQKCSCDSPLHSLILKFSHSCRISCVSDTAKCLLEINLPEVFTQIAETEERQVEIYFIPYFNSNQVLLVLQTVKQHFWCRSYLV